MEILSGPDPDRYDKMTYRRCGRSGLQLPVVSLGLWRNLGEAGNDDLCYQCCMYAFDQGMTHFDLANNYGPPPGSAEQIFGRVLRDLPRDELIVSTKAGYTMWPGPYGDWGSKKYLVASLDQSLQRMGLEYVDIFYHHRPDPDTPLEETLGALDLIVRQGKALYVGVSNYPANLFNRAVSVAAENGWAPITIHQPRYNMLDRWVEDRLLHDAQAAGTGIIAFCPLANGVLTERYLGGLPRDARLAGKRERYQKLREDGTLDKVALLKALASQRGQSLPQLALSWLLRHEAVTSVLIGVSRLEQLVDDLGAVKAPPLSAQELGLIDRILAGGGV